MLRLQAALTLFAVLWQFLTAGLNLVHGELPFAVLEGSIAVICVVLSVFIWPAGAVAAAPERGVVAARGAVAERPDRRPEYGCGHAEEGLALAFRRCAENTGADALPLTD